MPPVWVAIVAAAAIALGLSVASIVGLWPGQEPRSPLPSSPGRSPAPPTGTPSEPPIERPEASPSPSATAPATPPEPSQEPLEPSPTPSPVEPPSPSPAPPEPRQPPEDLADRLSRDDLSPGSHGGGRSLPHRREVRPQPALWDLLLPGWLVIAGGSLLVLAVAIRVLRRRRGARRE